MPIKEYQINEYLKLRLEGKETVIYVGRERFRQCKYLLIDEIIRDDVSDCQEQVKNVIEEMQFTSIDEKAEQYSHELEESEESGPFYFNILPEEEFKAHCSALDAFSIYNYNTELLHSNIAFPLLKKLYKAGDQRAEKAFKEEIGRRFISGFEPVTLYLLKQGYVSYLSLEQLESLTVNLGEKIKKLLEKVILEVLTTPPYIEEKYVPKAKLYNFLKILNNGLASSLEYVEYDGKIIFVKEGVLEIYIFENMVERIPEIINLKKLVSLRKMCLRHQKIKKIEGLEMLVDLDVLDLHGNQIEEIEGLKSLSDLKELILGLSKIKEIKGLESLRYLNYLRLDQNEIEKIEGLKSVGELKSLLLNRNKIERIEGLDELKNLEYLNLSQNKIERIEGLDELKNLKNLDLSYNRIKEIEGLNKLKNLEYLNLSNNMIQTIKGLGKLENLTHLDLSFNRIDKKDGAENLKRLNYLDLLGNPIKPIDLS